jgi:hypothetical protein
MELTDEVLYLYPYVSSLAISISYSEHRLAIFEFTVMY